MNTKQQTLIDLNLTAAWCEYKFPKARPLVLFGAMYERSCAQIAMIAADYQFILTRDGPVVDEAYKCMATLGYKVGWEGIDPPDFAISASNHNQSHHHSLAAIAYFTSMGLS